MTKKLSLALSTGLFALLAALLLPGCSSISLPSWPWSAAAPQPNATAEALFEEGMTYFNNKKYPLAVDRLQKVKAEFPFSPQLVSAELKLAEAYYLNKQYPEAAAAFKEFQELHPNNENIPFVLYHLGLVHFEQFTSSDRTQKVTEIAKGYFESVVKNHPNSPYTTPAKEKLARCLEYLSEYEFNIATFYFNEKKYPAAIDRFEGILRRYRDTPIAVKALYYVGESYRLEKNNVKAALAYEALVQYYPQDSLAKSAQVQLSELAKEKQDPLAMLLKRDGRPQLALPQSGQPPAVSGQQKQEKELNLVAKKDVVYEEPGEEKGMFRRVLDTLNPFASSSDKKENGGKEIETAKGDSSKKESNGFFGSLWRGLSPFSKEDQGKSRDGRDSQLVGRIDASLKQQGVDVAAQDSVSRLPAQDLPQEDLSKAEERAPPPADTAELLGRIDTSLKKEGKNAAELPSPPEVAPALRAVRTEVKKPAASKPESSSPVTSGLIANIDQALKGKGIDPAKMEEAIGKSDGNRPEGQDPGREASGVKRQEKIELAPRLATEKNPFFLDPGEYATRENAREAEQPQQPGNLEASQPPSQPAPETPKGLPQAVVKGPPQPLKEKPAETKVAEKKKSPDEEGEGKGVFDQLKEDLGRVRDLLNPFAW